MSSKLNAIQRAAVLTAMQKAIADALDGARAEADADLASMYDDMGVNRIAVKIDGREIGSFSVNFSKEGWAITDLEAFQEFALTYGFAHELKKIKPEYMGEAVRILERELPEAVATEVEIAGGWEKLLTDVDGAACYLDTAEVVPGVSRVPKAPKGTALKGCDPEAVMPAVRALGGIDALLLGEAPHE